MNCLKTELYRLRRSKMLYLSILIGSAICIWLFMVQINELRVHQELLQQYGTVKEGLYYPESTFNHFIGLDYIHGECQTLYTILPLLASLPFAGTLVSDKKYGYIQNIVTRTTRNSYYISKIITVLLSGFIVTLSILIFDLLLTMCVFPILPPEVITANYPSAYEESMFLELFINHPFTYTLLYIMIDSIFMGLIAVTSLIIGLFIPNTYIAATSGTIFYYFASYLFSIFQFNTQNPYVYLIPYQPFQGIKFSVIIAEMTALLGMCLIIFWLKEGRNKDVLSV